MQDHDAFEVEDFAGYRIELKKINDATFVAFCPQLGIKSFGQCAEQVLDTLRSEMLFELTKGEGLMPDPETLLLSADPELLDNRTRIIYLPPKNTRQ